MAFTIAVITDIHYATGPVTAERKGELGDVFLLRAVHRLNRLVHPDVTLLLGDCVDDDRDGQALDRLLKLKNVFDKLTSPWIALPGNHDPAPNRFYEVFPRPTACVDIGDVRFISFLDGPAPGYNASRSPADLQRLCTCRGDHAGAVITLQHVPVLPPLTTNCPYTFVNIEEVLAASRSAHVTLSIGGHYHDGTDLTRDPTAAYIAAPALCEAPFTVTLITLADPGRADGGDIRVERQPLQLPRELALADTHVHTPFAYCNGNMDSIRTLALAQALGLAEVTFSEHTGQLYFDANTFWSGEYCRHELTPSRLVHNRMAAYLDHVRELQRQPPLPTRLGLEVDVDFRGNPILPQAVRAQVERLNGAVHYLPESLQPKDRRNAEELARQFMTVTPRLIASGIHILVHPFRIFRWENHEPPRDLFAPIARLLRRHGVAAEINFHHNQPEPEFFAICLELGVKIALGSDAHELYEVGEFAPHLQFLQRLGAMDSLRDILWMPAV